MPALSTARAAALLLMAALQLSILTVDAYSVRYGAKTSAPGMMNFGLTGYCAAGDSGHSMMPKFAAYQASAYSVMSANSFTSAPIGGESRQSACLDANCTWQFSHGLYYHNEITFFYGVYYNDSGLHGGPADGVFNNFASDQPQLWTNMSYWGSRQPYMRGDGKWANTNVVTFFTQWVCEYYEFKKSDASLFPTYPDGDVIVPSSTSSYTHCGRRVDRDSQGRWLYYQCKKPFPWWAALTIAVVVLIVVVVIIIVVCCCCFYCDRNEERHEREEKLETMADNPAQVPTQTELGLSRHSSVFRDGRADEYPNEDGDQDDSRESR
ncbi:hypothetical protein ABB37_08659 [Leptomonas pyrrhocoris]|uniref:Uncharacterized protein n=1 Tax=Leptomonas pyrrhocoris TaxID=157538 RepID=A0A0N0DSB8_LEPPY|nr:hypothetical protein ABB37_08659 [Leptomonas pyrrhocoris]KPA75381.1 hypothetical protein ABB37_08659 [Leptomonas pyrrhocoris]|eukprot:XP_015653820.1 hypothetical protein ABB37_08659 [Leptomonas pyrrhocoris]